MEGWTPMRLPDGRTLTMQRDHISRGVDDHGWEINEPGPTQYYLDGEPIPTDEARRLIDTALRG